jgi:hypothetical protein
VIPDQALPEAASVLRQAGFHPCTNGRECPFAHDTLQFIPSPPASAHFHMTGRNVVLLFKKSKTLWNVTSFSASPKSAPGAKIILASDREHLPKYEPGLGEGAFPDSLHPIRMPSAHCLVETYSSLMLRDWGEDYGTFWMSMLAYIMRYVDDKGRLDLNQVEKGRKNFYLDMKAGKVGTAQAIRDFKQAMKAAVTPTKDADKSTVKLVNN